VGACVGEVSLGRRRRRRRRRRRSSELELSGVVEMQQGRVKMRNGETGSKTTSGGGDDDHREVATRGKQLEQKLLTLPTILTLTRVAAVPAMLAGMDLFTRLEYPNP
jgi:hypothetical protein